MKVTNRSDISYKNSPPVIFKGLTSKLSNAVYAKEEVVALCKQYDAKSKGVIGKAPASWIYSIPFEKRPEMLKELFANFGELLSELRGQKDSYLTKKSVQKRIKILMKQTGIIKSRDKVKLTYSDSGSFADVYRLDVKDESFAIKIFKKLLQTGWTYHEHNGNFFEQPVAQYLKKKIPAKKNNWFKYYFGDLYNGIMVSRFENGDYPFDGKAFNTEKIGILTSREHYTERNNLDGRILDIGMVDIMPHAKNKTMRYIYAKTMYDQLAAKKILEETLKWKPSQIYYDRLKGAFYSMQIMSTKNAKDCLDLILPAANKEVSLYMAENIYYAPYKLRQDIFDALYIKNNKEIDLALADKLEAIERAVGSDSKNLQLLKERNDNDINKILAKYL